MGCRDRRAGPTVLRILFTLVLGGAPACTPGLFQGPPEAPTPGPESRCAAACVAQAHACAAAPCLRGCRLVLDKLVEHEGAHVLACVARAAKCDDATFADCAARTGPYLDGGPPPPRPPSADEGD